jgi:TPR repeat protein
MLYANGMGVEHNYAEARRWWQKAADGGHPLAAASVAYGRGGGGAPRPAPAAPPK